MEGGREDLGGEGGPGRDDGGRRSRRTRGCRCPAEGGTREMGEETGVWTGGHGVGSEKSSQRKVGRGLEKEDLQVKRNTADRPIDGAWAERGSR